MLTRFKLSVFMISLTVLFSTSCQKSTSPNATQKPIDSGESPRVLLILAHPDDETMLGASLLLFEHQHIPVYALYLTRGEGGKQLRHTHTGWLPHAIEPGKLVAIREKEQKDVLSNYGISNYSVLGFSDTPLRRADGKPTKDLAVFLSSKSWDIEKAKQGVSNYARLIQPSIVITFKNDIDAHAHHKVARHITETLFDENRLGEHVKSLIAFEESGWLKKSPQDEAYASFVSVDRSKAYPGKTVTLGTMLANINKAYVSQWSGHRHFPEGKEIFLPIRGSLDYFFNTLCSEHKALCNHQR